MSWRVRHTQVTLGTWDGRWGGEARNGSSRVGVGGGGGGGGEGRRDMHVLHYEVTATL
jgi:hypothetical protein